MVTAIRIRTRFSGPRRRLVDTCVRWAGWYYEHPHDRAPGIRVETFVGGLDVPWEIAFAPDGRIFVTERPGRIRTIVNGQLQPEPWLTLDVAATGEGGLLGMAVDPSFAQNRFVYVAHTYRNASGDLRNRLVRLWEDAATGKGVLDKVLLDDVGGGSIHDGGHVKFGPDGKLYWTVGVFIGVRVHRQRKKKKICRVSRFFRKDRRRPADSRCSPDP